MDEISTRGLIMGTGFSGLCLAIKLQQQGINDFLLLDKAEEVGGTWRENTYPGAECDVPSALYSFSFEPNPTWAFKWAEQPQILDYLKSVANKHKLYEKIHFRQQVVSARYEESSQRWRVACSDGQCYSSQYFIVATGQLHKASIPQFEGQDAFEGPAFHSAQWDHSVDLNGKRVAVIGNAASALQFIPEIAPQASRLTVFQRSPNWVLPKNDRPYSAFERKLAQFVPGVTKLYRLKLWLRGEWPLFALMQGQGIAARIAERVTKRYIEREIDDPALREKLLPDYPIGAKRVLWSDNYYTALNRPNVDVCTEGVARFDANGIVKGDGSREDFDVVIYGTGFETNPFVAPVEVQGLGGLELQSAWSEGAHAYYGVMTHGFPNMMLMYGPNTNLGHNSIVLMIEAQSDYIINCMREAEQRGVQTLQVSKRAEAAYNDELQARLQRMVWAQTDHSWYLDRGRITNNWAGRTWEYMRRMKKVDFDAYEFQ
jgi:cation diffusion facilitator CzcD-associated flavoprotein CzcO